MPLGDSRPGLLSAVVASNDRLAGRIWAMHAAGAFLLIALVALHVAAALRHAWLLRDDVLRRMTPPKSHHSRSRRGGFVFRGNR
jgi:cytochrome b561